MQVAHGTPLADQTAVNVGNAGKVLLDPADNYRQWLRITALKGNTDQVRIGDSTVDSAKGMQLQPGDSVDWPAQEAIYACAEATAGQGVALVRFK